MTRNDTAERPYKFIQNGYLHVFNISSKQPACATGLYTMHVDTRVCTMHNVLSWTWKSSRMTGAGTLSAYRTLHAVHMLIRPAAHNNTCMCVLLTYGYMASALGPLDVRPDFHVHNSTSALKCLHIDIYDMSWTLVLF